MGKIFEKWRLGFDSWSSAGGIAVLFGTEEAAENGREEDGMGTRKEGRKERVKEGADFTEEI